MINKAIIIAAGLGGRLMPYTENIPKCLLKVGDKTIFEHQQDTLRSAGISEHVVVRGYKKDLLNFPGIRFCDNDDFENNNILGSLFCAEQEMDTGFIFSYSDIIYGKDIIEKLQSTLKDIVLVVDKDWQAHYQGREKHPITEAELVKASGDRIIKIGKDVVSIPESTGEFIGLAKFSTEGAKILKQEYALLREEYKNKEDQCFQNAKLFAKAYLTDMMQHLIDKGITVSFVEIESPWFEIDTDEDLARATAHTLAHTPKIKLA